MPDIGFGYRVGEKGVDLVDYWIHYVLREVAQ
jgi:hypothetical protein